MKRLSSFFIICFLIFIGPPSCISTTPIQELNLNSMIVVEEGRPEQAYVHLSRGLFIDVITGPQRIGSINAGGVCVASDDAGCFVLTVNHFCERRKSDEPNVPGLYAVMSAENTNGGASVEVEIVDTMPEADLCLLRVDGTSFLAARGITLPEMAPRFSELQNYGAPAGHFNGSVDFWNLSMYEGRWSGHCTERCNIPDARVQNRNLILHTLPTTRGQSGSGIFIGDSLFGIQVATNSAIEDFGIAANSRSIYLLLQRNGIHLEFLSLEEQR